MEIEKEKEINQPHDPPKSTDAPAADDHREPDSQNNNAVPESESKQSETPKIAGESITESSESPEDGKSGDGGGGGGEEETPATNEEPPAPDFSELCREMDNFIASLSAGAKTADGESKTEEAETKDAKTEEAEPGETKEEAAETEEAKTEEPKSPEIPDIADQFAFLAEANIANHDLMKWTQLPEDESSSFLEIVDRIARLSSALSAFSSVAKYGPLINRTGGILQRAMSYLEDEFRSLLEEPPAADSDQKDNDLKPKDSPATETEEQPVEEPKSDGDKNKNTHGYSDEIVKSLNTLAKTMIKGGYETECFQVYIVARRTALEEALHKSAFEKLSIDEIQRMQWEQLEREIDTWTSTFKHFVTVNFVSEKDLLFEVFKCEGFTIPDDVFATLSRGIMIQLLNFAEAVAVAKRSSEKLFKFIDIYETLRDVIPKIDELWNEENCNELKTEASLTRCRLGEGIVSIFTELENSIKADTGKTQVPGGAVHPLTRYTMNYLKYACEYKETLEQVFREHQKIERADSVPGSDFDHTAAQSGGSGSGSGGAGQAPPSSNKQGTKPSPFATEIYKVMDLLDANLEAKSKLYKDHALSSIFMMNNGRYILQKIKGSAEIHALMGDTWSRKRSSDLRNYHKTYQRETWGRLLGCLSQEGLNVNGKVSKPALKEKFKAFNAMFDEIHKTQSQWVVSDEQLQSELRVSISAVVIPAYRSFLARYSQIFTAGRQTEKYIKHQPEDIETSIDELFDGNATPTGRKKQ